MLIYSESIHVEPSIEQQWTSRIRNLLIQQVQGDKINIKKIIFSQLISPSQENGKTFSLQYYFESWRDLENFKKTYPHGSKILTAQEFGEKALVFSSELNIIEIFSC